MPNQTISEFERQVIADLAELKTDMKSLVGNGQKGRVEKLEDSSFRLTLGGVVLGLLVLGPKGLEFIAKFL